MKWTSLGKREPLGGSNMMRIALIPLLAVGFLASCSMTPKDLMSKGYQSHYASQADPTNAAWCMGRAAENIHAIYQASVRPFSSESMVELVVRDVRDAAQPTTKMVAHASASDKGSKITLWLRFDRRSADFREAIVNACGLTQEEA